MKIKLHSLNEFQKFWKKKLKKEKNKEKKKHKYRFELENKSCSNMYLIKGKFVDRDCFCVMKDINFFFNIYGLESILSINFIYSLLKKNTREKGLQQ